MSNYSRPRKRSDGRVRNVVVDDQGNRVVLPTSAQRSGQMNANRLVVPGVLDNPRTPKPGALGLIGESRAERVTYAKANGTFAAIRRKYNQENPGFRMDKNGNTHPRNKAAPGGVPGTAEPAPGQPLMTREQLVAQAKKDGTFEKTRNDFNASSKHQWMDDEGKTRVGPKITNDGNGGKTLEGKYGTGSSTTGPAGTKVAGDARLREETAAIKARQAKGIYGDGYETAQRTAVAKTPPKINGLQPDPGKLPQTISAKPADMMKLETPQITKPIAASVPPTALPANINDLAPKGPATIQQSPGFGPPGPGPAKFQETRSNLAGANAGTTQMEEARKKARTA